MGRGAAVWLDAIEESLIVQVGGSALSWAIHGVIMNRRLKIDSAGAIALAVVFASGFALAAQRTAPVKDPAAQARAQELIDSVRDGAGVFKAEDTGNVVHIRSGMACAVGDEMLTLVRVSIRPSFTLGDDVT